MATYFVDPDEIISHFEEISDYIRNEQFIALNRISYLKTGSRSRIYSPQRRIQREMDALRDHAVTWSHQGLLSAYVDGSRTMLGADSVVKPTRRQLESLAKISEEYRSNVLQMHEFTKRDSSRFFREMRNRPTASIVDESIDFGFDRSLGIKAVEFKDKRPFGGRPLEKVSRGRRYKVGDYGKMQTRSSYQRAFNLGALDAAKKRKLEYVEVSDGPGCGWTGHDDPDIADGKIVTISEARSYPLAHPNCQRSFIARPDLTGKPEKDRKGLSKAQQASALLGAAAAVGATRALFQVTTEIVDPDLAVRFLQMDRIGLIYRRAYNRLLDRVSAGQRGRVIPFHSPPPPPEDLPIAVGQGQLALFPGITQGQFSAIRGPVGSRLGDWQDDVMAWGDQFMDRRWSVPQLPDWVKSSIHILDTDTESVVSKKFLAFGRWVHGSRTQSRSLEAGAQIINFHSKRRAWNEFLLLKQSDTLKSAASLTWTKYGPRTRIDLTEFLRGRVTLTKDGVRKSITFSPAGNVRNMLALSQDGTLLGAIRYVPNHMLRAIIETDEFGKLTGNVRLVPKGPFKVIMRFETPRPQNWKNMGLVPGRDFVDLRRKAALERGFNLEDFSFRDVYGVFKQLELKDIAFEARVFNKSIYELSTEFKIPIPQVRETVEKLVAAKKLRKEGFLPEAVRDITGYTGDFRFIPTKEQLTELMTLLQGSTQRVFGEIKFSSLHSRIASLLPNLRTKAYFESGKFQEVLTSVKLSGLDVVRGLKNLQIADIFDIPIELWNDFRDVLSEVESRTILFLMDNHRPGLSIRGKVLIPEGILFNKPFLEPKMVQEVFEKRYSRLISELQPVNNRADIFKGVLQAIRTHSDSSLVDLQRKARQARRIVPGGQTHRKWLSILADIRPTDGAATIELKLREMVYFMRSLEIDSEDVMSHLDLIDDQMISLASRSLTGRRLGNLEDQFSALFGRGFGAPTRSVKPGEVIELYKDIVWEISTMWPQQNGIRGALGRVIQRIPELPEIIGSSVSKIPNEIAELYRDFVWSLAEVRETRMTRDELSKLLKRLEKRTIEVSSSLARRISDIPRQALELFRDFVFAIRESWLAVKIEELQYLLRSKLLGETRTIPVSQDVFGVNVGTLSRVDQRIQSGPFQRALRAGDIDFSDPKIHIISEEIERFPLLHEDVRVVLNYFEKEFPNLHPVAVNISVPGDLAYQFFKRTGSIAAYEHGTKTLWISRTTAIHWGPLKHLELLKSYQTGYTGTSSLRSILMHEMGHAIHYSLSAVDEENLIRDLLVFMDQNNFTVEDITQTGYKISSKKFVSVSEVVKQMSTYATQNTKEFIAEAIAVAVEHGDESIPNFVYSWINSRMKQRNWNPSDAPEVGFIQIPYSQIDLALARLPEGAR